jgi:hypothetical protein
VLGLALVHSPTDAKRDRGQLVLADVRDSLARQGHNSVALPVANIYLGRERARRGDHDAAIPVVRAAFDQLVREERLLSWGIPATGVLVETLLERGARSDLIEARVAIERLATAHTDHQVPVRDLLLLRLRALLARAHGDAAAYADLKARYSEMATSLRYEGHIAWAQAMP